jgi:hypothetical protein
MIARRAATLLKEVGTQESEAVSAPTRFCAVLQPFFAQADLYRGPIPDETSILNFRRLLATNELAPEILSRVNAYLTRKGLMLKRGSIVDPTIMSGLTCPVFLYHG